MMNNKKLMVIIALAVFLVGLVGAIICITPSQTPEEKLIGKYVNAINKGDTEKMHVLGIASVISDALGSQLGGLLDGIGSGISGDAFDEDEKPTDKIYTALLSSPFSVTDDIPENFKEIKSVEVIGCVVGEQQNIMSLQGTNVGVVLEITFVDAEDNTQTVCCAENIGVIKYKSDYYISG